MQLLLVDGKYSREKLLQVVVRESDDKKMIFCQTSEIHKGKRKFRVNILTVQATTNQRRVFNFANRQSFEVLYQAKKERLYFSSGKFDNVLIVPYNKQNKNSFIPLPMMRKGIPNQKNNTHYSKSFSNLHHPQISSIDLKEFYLRKSIFDPPEGLAEVFISRSHLPGADVPLIEVVHSDQRWLLLQSPKMTQNVFSKIDSGTYGNPYQLVLQLFKSMVVLSQMYGYFLVTSNMTFLQNKQVRVWINENIFSNQIQIPLRQGPLGEKEFVLGFFLMLEKEMKDWERVTSVFTIEDTEELLKSRSRINRRSLTAVHTSKAIFPRPHDSSTSFDPHELKYYSTGFKGCQSMKDIEIPSHLEYIKADMSSSYTIKEEEHLMFKKSMNKNLLYDSKDLKNSIDPDFSPHEPEVRKTKKKFNLTSTSSTLEKFSQKLTSTISRKALRLKNEHPGEKPKEVEVERRKDKNMHKSEPISIANELDGLFEEDQKHAFQLGVEGDKEQLEKIAEEIQQVLIW